MKWRIRHQRANDSTTRSKEPEAKRVQVGVLRRGFTIVELLIVVVVIAILAAITIVAYNSITAQARESTLKSDLNTAAKKLNLEKVENGSFPGTYVATGLTYSGGGNVFCVTGSANGKDFRIKETGNVEEGDCALPVATTMQTFTSAHCSALATFTGSNNSAVVSLTDSRGGTTRTYEVAKLADGKCWMLTNLKLGSTTGTITLTPADSDVASNFTLPQALTTGSTADSGVGNGYDTPYVYGPVLDDTGVGATNYGYLYNWSAATAGESRITMPEGSGDAAHSICATNWRLPSGGYGSGEFFDLDLAFGGNGWSAWNSEPNALLWHHDGPFKGVLAGGWHNSFFSQGEEGRFWSGTADSGYIAGYTRIGAYLLLLTNWGGELSVSNDQGGYSRAGGYAVRCILR